MTEKLRKTGMHIIGDVQWGTHFCQFYQTKEDLIDILIPYFKAGLTDNEFCMWVVSDFLTLDEAIEEMRKAVPGFDLYLANGQMVIILHNEWYLSDAFFDPQRILDGWRDKYSFALTNGYDGIRVAGDTDWLEKKDWRDFCGYEQKANSIIGSHKMIALCAYCLDKCGPAEAVDIVANHKFAIIRLDGTWKLIENTDRKRVEKELQETERRYRSLSDMTSDYSLMLSVDQHGHMEMEWFNEGFSRMLGYTFDEVRYPYLWRNIILPDDFPGFVEFAKDLAAGRAGNYEMRVITKTGETIYLNIYGKPEWDDQKKRVSRILGAGKNITERKRLEEELKESEQRFRTIFDKNTDGMIVADIENKKFCFANPMICRMLGYGEDELGNLGVMDIHTAEDLPYVFEEFERQARKEVTIAENIPVKRKDGTVFYADITASPVILGGKEYLIGTFRDITERKLAEEAIRKRNEELTDLNREVARQREQLRAFALKLAEAEENERKSLSQELHDEVGQNLTALGINLNVALSQATEEAAETIRTRIADSLALVDQIAERIRNVMANLRPPLLDDYGLVAALKWYAEMFSSRTGISVIVQGREIVPRPAAKVENSIFRIVQEALTNVAKHAQATHVVIAIETGTRTIRVNIADNGIGFDSSLQSEPNKWGLITMRERARAIGGQLRIESAAARGTNVIAEAPL